MIIRIQYLKFILKTLVNIGPYAVTKTKLTVPRWQSTFMSSIDRVAVTIQASLTNNDRP